MENSNLMSSPQKKDRLEVQSDSPSVVNQGQDTGTGLVSLYKAETVTSSHMERIRRVQEECPRTVNQGQDIGCGLVSSN